MLWLMSYKAIHKTDNNRGMLQTHAITSLIIGVREGILLGGGTEKNLPWK